MTTPAAPPCQLCTGACCRNTGYPFATRLTTQEATRPVFQEFAEWHQDEGDWIIPYANDACPFLQGTACSIYEQRPEACREFNCVAGHNARGPGCHSFFLEDNPEVVKLIELHVIGRGSSQAPPQEQQRSEQQKETAS